MIQHLDNILKIFETQVLVNGIGILSCAFRFMFGSCTHISTSPCSTVTFPSPAWFCALSPSCGTLQVLSRWSEWKHIETCISKEFRACRISCFLCGSHPERLFSMDADQKIKTWPLGGPPALWDRHHEGTCSLGISAALESFSSNIVSEGWKRSSLEN